MGKNQWAKTLHIYIYKYGALTCAPQRRTCCLSGLG